MNQLRIGVVGYSAQKFDEDRVRHLINQAYDALAAQYQGRHFVVVSGLSNFGMPKIAYQEAERRNWITAGITLQYRVDRGDPFFPVDEQIIIAGERGAESPAFLANIHVLVCIGGGPQSLAEAADFRRSGQPVLEYDLPALVG